MLIHLGGEPFTVATLVWSAPDKGHDRLLVAEGFVGVADGATPLAGQTADPGAFAADALQALRREGRSAQPARENWRRAIASLRASVVEDPPVSCSMTAVRDRGTDLEFSRLGDCAAVVTLVHGSLLRLVDTDIAPLDQRARASDSPADVYRDHRALMNTAAGYWIVADEPAAADHVQVLTVPVVEVTGFALFSDGAAALFGADRPPDDDSTVVVARKVAR